MSIADNIRDFAYRTYIKPGLSKGLPVVEVRTGDVHRDMRLSNNMPSVCSALESRKFQHKYNLSLVDRRGPRRGSNVYLQFAPSGAAPKTDTKPTSPVTIVSKSRTATRRRSKTDGSRVYLLSCVSVKCSTACQAQDFYISPWFIKARRYVETVGSPWYILSAKHGLVDPTQIIAPYDLTLNTMPSHQRKAWAAHVIDQIDSVIPASTDIAFLAGQRYREYLIEPLLDREHTISIPMEGLRRGEQLAWLDAHA